MTLSEMYNVINKYIDDENVQERRKSATFLIWFLVNIYNLDKDEAIACVCDEENDKGIDAIYIDSIEEEIHIFQSKYKMSDNTSIGDSILRDFEGVNSWFSSKETVKDLKNSRINAELKALLNHNNIEDIIEDYEIKYNFIINAKRDHNTDEYLKVNKNINLWCLNRIKDFYHQISFDPFVKDTFIFNNITSHNVIKLNNNIITLPIKASDLIRLNGISDLSLFNSNVRFGLGNTRVNKSIKKTLSNPNEKDNFIMFHNGISLVCEDFEYDEKSLELKLSNYSIVNGAQSTLTFYNNNSLLDDNIKVMAKIVKTGTNQTLSDLITYYSNNQNSISMKDLRSNDKVQVRLINQFNDLQKKYDIKIKYVPKKGTPNQSGYYEIYSDYAAQLITSCYLKRPFDTHLKTSLFDTKYDSIFNRNIDARKIYIYYYLHKLVIDNLSQIEDKKIASYGLAQFAFISTIFEILESNECTNFIKNGQDEYFNNLESNNNFLKILIETIIQIFNFTVEETKESKGEDFIYKNDFKSKDFVNSFKRSIINSFNTQLKMSRKDFLTFFNDNIK